MSNNRMWLRNVRTGSQILLAKYLPSTGWCVAPTLDVDKLDTFLEEQYVSEVANLRDGDNEWGVLYECGEPNEGETVQDPVTKKWSAKT